MLLCKYTIKDLLRHMTFEQVAKYWDLGANNFVDVKIIKNWCWVNQKKYFVIVSTETGAILPTFTFTDIV